MLKFKRENMVKNIIKKAHHHAKKERTRHLLALLVSGGFLLTGIFILWFALVPLPDFQSFEQRKIEESTKIYDRTGEVLLFDVYRDVKRQVVPFEEISRYARNATVAIEDSEFYDHKGVKPTAIARAFISNLLSFDLRGQGGSTITQQVVKLTLLTNEKRYVRKLKEAVLSLKLERVLEKDEILHMYLNEAPYGGTLYGIEEASLAFFGKNAKDVSLAESAYLAALPQAPTYYSPYGDNTDDLEARKNLVLDRMVELGFITEEEAAGAKQEEVLFAPPSEQGIKAPHFVMYVREYLEREYGRDAVETQGLNVITTLDWELQQKAEEIVARYAELNAENFNASNAGIIAIDPKTGHILTMVGSKDYFDTEEDGNFNITLAKRQPGSAFKPFVYATAFKEGYTPDTTVFDLPTQFSTACDSEGEPLPGVNPDVCYSPVNYDNTFRGPISLRDALAQSVNIPAVKTLYLAGLIDSLETARDLGISSLNDVNQYGLTLVLGGGEVTLLELTSAYSVFANNGLRNPHEKIIKIEDKNGNVLEEFNLRSRRVLEEDVALQINDVLSDNDARAPSFGFNSPLHFPGRDVAAKTGTTNDYRDAWIVGYTPNIAIGAWAGNNDNSSMERRVAGFVVAPMWNEFMREALNKFPPEQFKQYTSSTDPRNIKPVLRGVWEGGQVYEIDSISGNLATEFTPDETREQKVIKEVHSILHWVNKNNPNGNVPENPENDSQYELWETPVRKWVEDNGIIEETSSVIPTELDTIHKPEFRPTITITSPGNNQNFTLESSIAIGANIQGVNPVTQVDFFFNGEYLGTRNSAPFTFTVSPSSVSYRKGTNTITVRAYDTVRNVNEESVSIDIR
ncbi:hypothetical protein CL654_00905 [bacterium]|nr:hypothetical protein [bacterium]|tara:strand:- start:5581 stop:8142 length:2562 start_codon:yes stop_codon:yes gene_type:complete